METDNKLVFVFFSFLVFAHCTDVNSTEGNGVEPDGDGHLRPAVHGGHLENHEPATTEATAPQSNRAARQFYQPFIAYHPYPQRRAFKGPGLQLKKKPMRTKPGRRPRPPRRRPAVGPAQAAVPMPMQTMGRYRRLPPPMRTQQVNYIDSTGTDYEDGYESAPMTSVDYGDFDHDAYVFGQPGAMQQIPSGGGAPMIASSGRPRKRPVATAMAYAPEDTQAVVHVPVRVQARPVAAMYPTPAPTTTADPMEKLRQLVHEAMDEHFASRHQGLYADGFDKQPHHPVQYSAKYKRQQVADDKDKDFRQSQPQHQSGKTTVDAVRAEVPVKKDVGSYASPHHHSSSDAEADGSDDRLTLAEISAYMGAKPAETVLSAGGHKYVLSDALQQSYRLQQQQNQQHQQHQYHHQQQFSGDDERDHQQQYLRYVSPFEAVYELPVVPRWMYK
ncbi:uncharacterized protein LOC112682349 [Sipha flava]|uniref:Uncharacterized protein LOC112682349 n=1 Tax=Sipha flava TaxID=143950 RepID=A0A2S2QUA9_9HEMI|nr:uncharacterized protein LOC112682349 [Sipha flava]XP_025408700.1 uncharacterized protein LOC112682349 [Sipha flava]XP_025408702.1 uncharacterized protein LOC112682349 [Sipha flava]